MSDRAGWWPRRGTSVMSRPGRIWISPHEVHEFDPLVDGSTAYSEGNVTQHCRPTRHPRSCPSR